VLAALVVAAVMLLRPEGDGPAIPAGRPPADVRLTDEGAQVQVLWSDPAGGSVPFVVSAGKRGEPLTVRGETTPGRRTHLVDGLDPGADYCFTVAARYGAGPLASSPQVCTTRAND
jgi:hypothetical protein